MKVIIKSIKSLKALACVFSIFVVVSGLISCDTTISSRNLAINKDRIEKSKVESKAADSKAKDTKLKTDKTKTIQKSKSNKSESTEKGTKSESKLSTQTLQALQAKVDSTTQKDYSIIKVTASGSKRVNRELDANKEEQLKRMVANSAEKIVEFFPLTFAYLKGKGIGIGLVDYNNANAYEAAAVAVSPVTHTWSSSTPGYGTAELEYSLQVNTNSIGSGNINNTVASTMAHETMHALMFEALSSGMSGFNADTSKHSGHPTRFHDWFIEGMAVIVGGGTRFVEEVLRFAPNINKPKSSDTLVVQDPHAQNINDKMIDRDYVKNALSQIRLKDGRLSNTKVPKVGMAVYGVGYMALAYLGQLIYDIEEGICVEGKDGSQVIPAGELPDSQKIRKGLDKLMSEIARGYSLGNAIKNLTHGKYKSVEDFEDNSLDELSNYVFKLIQEIKSGLGSTITKDLGDKDILTVIDRDMPTKPILLLNPEYTRMTNFYPNWMVVMKGGGVKENGYAFNGTYPSDVSKPSFAPVNPDTTVKSVGE